MAVNVRLVEEASPGGLVLSAGLMSGPGALLQTVTALHTCPPAVCRTWPCVLSMLRPEARRRSEQAEAPAQDSVPRAPGRPSHPDAVLTWGPWPQLFGWGQRSSGLAVTPAAQRAQKFLGWKLPKLFGSHWGPAPRRRDRTGHFCPITPPVDKQARGFQVTEPQRPGRIPGAPHPSLGRVLAGGRAGCK